MTKNYYALTISGKDGPGITAMVVGEIAKAKQQLIDIGQSVIFDFLTLSALVEVAEKQESEFFKNLLFECKKRNLNCDYKILELHNKDANNHSKKNLETFVITCVSYELLHAPFIAKLALELASHQFNIEKIDNTTHLNNYRVLEITVATAANNSSYHLKEKILSMATQYKTDIAVVENDLFRFNKRLIVFDMDSTLIEQEVIDELARLNNCYDQVQGITHRAMNGEIDFKKSLELRVSLLKGLSQSAIDQTLKKLKFTPGTKECLNKLKSLGFKTAIISGGFKPFTEFVRRELDMDYDFGNNLEIINETITGNVLGPIIDAQEKANILTHLALREGIQLKQTVAVGDGSNDLLMLKTAGMGIAFHAKEVVQKKSNHQLNHGPMTSILPMLGLAN